MSEKSLKDAFRQLLVNGNNQDGFFRARIIHLWPQLFGKNIARHTRKLEVKKRKLYVYVDSSTVRGQLMMLRGGIKDRLNEELGEAYVQEVMVK